LKTHSTESDVIILKKKFAYGVLIVMIVGALGVASVLAYSLVVGNTPFDDPYASYENEEYAAEAPREQEQTQASFTLPPAETARQNDGIPRITPHTLMIYEYYDPATSTFDRVEEMPAQILLGKSREDVANMFVDWRILSFASEQVHLRQNDALEHRRFTIATHEGFIAVFYDNDQTTIKELTNRPVDALAKEEQDRLAEGIHVIGNEELIRALEDFGS